MPCAWARTGRRGRRNFQPEHQWPPHGWGLTSGDAAGLPSFPALVRYDEAERGMVEHACRIVVKHFAQGVHLSGNTRRVSHVHNGHERARDGQRVRLKAYFTIPDGWTKKKKAVLLALKKYGALVADNGNYFPSR